MSNTELDSTFTLRHKTLRQAKKLINSAAQLSWPTHKLFYKTLLRRYSKHPPLIVYTMGKVGSNTIHRSIANSQSNLKSYQVHWLTKENMHIDEAFCYHQEKKCRRSGITKKFRPTYVWNAEHLLKRFNKTSDLAHKWKVVSLTRDPVARNISSFFQNLELFYGYNINQKILSSEKDQVIFELRNLFYAGFIENHEAIRADCNPLTWFTDELGKVFEIDVFKKPFPRDRGYEVYEAPNAEILIIKLEKLRQCAEAALNHFGVHNFELTDANKASRKPYAAIYKDFVRSITLPDHYIDKLYDSQYCRHFYSDEEICTFRNYWRKRRC